MSQQKPKSPEAPRRDPRDEALKGLRPSSMPPELRSAVLDAAGAALRSAAPTEEASGEAPERDRCRGDGPWVIHPWIDRAWESRALRLGWLAAAALLLALNLRPLDSSTNPAAARGTTLIAEAHDDDLPALPEALGGLRRGHGLDPRRGILDTWTLNEVRQQLSSEEWL